MFKRAKPDPSSKQSGSQPEFIPLSSLDQLGEYDLAKYGSLVEFKGLEGYQEVERYWLEKPYSMAVILYDPDKNRHLYHVCEPQLDAYESAVLYEFKQKLRDVLLDAPAPESHEQKRAMIVNLYNQLIRKYGIKLTVPSYYKIKYYLVRDFVHFDRITPLMRDPLIEDISCDGWDTDVFLYHKNYINIPTNIKFRKDELDAFVVRLAQRAGKHISFAVPLVDATLMDGSRIQMSFGREITTKGSTFTIRKFREVPFTPVDLIKLGTFSPEMISHLWICIENNKSMIFAGGTASGKSIPGWERILIYRNGSPELIPISRLFAELAANSKIELDPDGYQYIDCSRQQLYAACFSPQLKLELGRIRKLIRHPAPAKLYLIRTRSGRSVTVTGDHSVFVLESGMIQSFPASRLRPGQHIAVPRNLPEPNHSEDLELISRLAGPQFYLENVASYLRAAISKLGLAQVCSILGLTPGWVSSRIKRDQVALQLDGFRRLASSAGIEYDPTQLWIRLKSSRRSRIPALIKLSPELMQLVGLWVAGGMRQSKGISFRSKEPWLKQRIEELCSKALGLKIKLHPSTPTKLDLRSKLVKEFFSQVLNLDAKNKSILSLIFAQPNSKLAAFLSGYASGNGSICPDGTIELCTKDRELADQLAYSLLRFGIVARLSQKFLNGAQHFRIRICGHPDLSRFQSWIGFCDPIKSSQLAELISNQARLSAGPNLIPFLGGLTRSFPAGTGFELLWNGSHPDLELNLSPEHGFLNFIQEDPWLKVQLRILAEAEIFWDRIWEVISMDSAEDYVYDLEVDPHQNFVGGFGGIFLHNTTSLNAVSLFIPYQSKIVCASPDTKIPLQDGIATLGDLVEQKLSADPPDLKIQQGIITGSVAGVSTWGFDHQRFQLSPQPISKVAKLPAPPKLVRIRTEYGAHVDLTPNTKLPVLRSGNKPRLEFRSADQVSPGDHVLQLSKLNIRSQIPEFNPIQFALSTNSSLILAAEFLRECAARAGSISKLLRVMGWGSSWFYSRRLAAPKLQQLIQKLGLSWDLVQKSILGLVARKGRNPMRIFDSIPPELFYAAGLISSNGYITRKALVLDRSRIFPRFAQVMNRYFGANSNGPWFSSKPAAEFFSRVFQIPQGKKPHKIPIPPLVLTAPEQHILEFIRGCLDGNSSLSESELIFHSRSSEFLEQLSWLLLRLGIVSCYLGKISQAGIHGLSIRGVHRSKLCEQLGLAESKLEPELSSSSGLNQIERWLNPEELIWAKVSSVEWINSADSMVYDITPANHRYFPGGRFGFIIIEDTIEDTRELQLPHPNWIPGLTRDAFTSDGTGAIDMYDLLRAALRQRPEYIIVGEVRGREALTLFQAMSTGHTTYSTIHADSIDRVIHRLENPPISVPRSLIEALNLVSIQAQVWIKGKRARRVTSVVEITELDPQTRTLKTVEVYKWDPVADRHINVGISYHLEEIRQRRGWSRAELAREMDRRQRIFQYMIQNEITQFDQVAKIVQMYQTTPDKVLEMIGL